MTDTAVPLTSRQLAMELSLAVDRAGGQSAFGRAHGIRQSIISETINGHREPSPAVLNAIGYLKVDRFVPLKRRA